MTNSFRLDKVVEGISQDRLQPYRKPGETDLEALERYKNNILLSEAFYPSLHMLEVILRNNLERVLIKEFGDTWYQAARLTGLMYRKDKRGENMPTIAFDQLQTAIGNLKRARKPLGSGRVVAELTFGFWTGLFDKVFEQVIWAPYGTDLFPNAKPNNRDIKIIRVDLRCIRKLRNRIAHHEPIWNDPNLYSKYQAIRRFVRWLNAAAGKWLSCCDRYKVVRLRVYALRAKN